MVEGFLRERLQAAFPELIWSENNYEDPDNTGTVYKEAGEKPSTYEDDLRFPYYMVWIRSSNFDLAQKAAEGSIEVLNKLHNLDYTDQDGNEFHIIFVEATGEANRIGRTDGIMEWSSNFKVTLRRN